MSNAQYRYEIVQELPQTGEHDVIYALESNDPEALVQYTDFIYRNDRWVALVKDPPAIAVELIELLDEARRIVDSIRAISESLHSLHETAARHEHTIEAIEKRLDPLETPKTVLCTDGTLAINTLGYEIEDREVVKEYPPFSATNPYIFTGKDGQPWANERTQIKRVVFGQPIKATSMAFWFQGCTNLEQIHWLPYVDKYALTSLRGTFSDTAFTEIAVPEFPNLTNLRYAFARMPNCTKVDLSQTNANGITDISQMVHGSDKVEVVDMSGLAGVITECTQAFSNVSGGGDMALHTIYAKSDLDFSQMTGSLGTLFRGCVNLVGENGTTYVANKGLEYAHLDGGTDNPGYFSEREFVDAEINLHFDPSEKRSEVLSLYRKVGDDLVLIEKDAVQVHEGSPDTLIATLKAGTYYFIGETYAVGMDGLICPILVNTDRITIGLVNFIPKE